MFNTSGRSFQHQPKDSLWNGTTLQFLSSMTSLLVYLFACFIKKKDRYMREMTVYDEFHDEFACLLVLLGRKTGT